jgi:DNA-binding MarR family transcriptional regulator
MHRSNVVAAWAVAVHDELRAGIGRVGIDARELAALTLVAQHPGCTVEWLRGRIDLTQSGTVRLVDRLVDQGLLTREAPTGRVVPLRATARGRALVRRWGKLRDAIVDDLLAPVPADRRTALVEGMAAALTGRERTRPKADATCRTCSWPACGADCPVDRSVVAAST